MPRCDVIIPVWNRLMDTEECIESIRRNTLYPWRLIIVDNASDYKTAEYLEGLKGSLGEKILLDRSETNLGFIKAVNRGISLSDAEFICILNNDTLVGPGWLGEMVGLIKKDPSIGIVNPSSNTLGQRLPRGVRPDEFAGGLKKQSGLFVELGSAVGFCMLARRKLFDEIGLLDEAFGMGNFDDTDISLRAKARGYKTVRALASYVYHKEQRSFNLLKRFKSDFAKNRRIFESKWGGTKRAIVVLRNINPESLDYLRGILKEYAKEKSWVYIISPPFETIEFFEKHSNLSFYHYTHFFYVFSFLKILFKKKKPDIIYAGDGRFCNLLAKFRIFHSAEIRKISTP